MKPKITFIINPKAGTQRKTKIEELIGRHADKQKIEIQLLHTQAPGHATDLARASAQTSDLVVAVGGDGTVNEVAAGLLKGPCPMGILPLGSGNGLARHLRIPMGMENAIGLLSNYEIQRIDTLLLNDRLSLNVSGIGFDAHVGHLFAHSPKRGLAAYTRITAREFNRYETQKYRLRFNNQDIDVEAFAISFANSSQFGNNARIAPSASLQDGLIDMAILSKFPLVAAPILAAKLFTDSISTSRYMKIYQTSSVIVSSQDGEALLAHVDGEPARFEDGLQVSIAPLSLNLAIPKGGQRI